MYMVSIVAGNDIPVTIYNVISIMFNLKIKFDNILFIFSTLFEDKY